jgi:hypothetical protein
MAAPILPTPATPTSMEILPCVLAIERTICDRIAPFHSHWDFPIASTKAA